MARSPLASHVEQAFSAVSDERLTRRRLLERGAALGVAVATTGVWARAARAAKQPGGTRIVVVGGGLAGLVATYRLQQAGYFAELHEASTRLGGRCLTLPGGFPD